MFIRHADDPELSTVGAYWFEIVFAAMGVLAFFIGFSGISGADCGSQCCLGFHVLLLVVLGILELLVLIDWKWDIIKERIPDDPTLE